VKLHVEIEVDDKDLDAVSFALALRGLARPETTIIHRLEIVGHELIANAHEMLDTYNTRRTWPASTASSSAGSSPSARSS